MRRCEAMHPFKLHQDALMAFMLAGAGQFPRESEHLRALELCVPVSVRHVALRSENHLFTPAPVKKWLLQGLSGVGSLMLVIDIDPGGGVEWGFVTETPLKLRDVFKAEGISSWPKLSGSKGIHVMAPVDPDLDWGSARAYCKSLAERVATTTPRRDTTGFRRKALLPALRPQERPLGSSSCPKP
jgi:hypothetical protein